MAAIRLHVNGRTRLFQGEAFKRLIDVLREDFALNGTKEGCGEGECGACTVLLDGEPVNSCLIPVGQMQGRRIETIESLGTPERLNVLQNAFLEQGGAQCGICTPGMIMSAWAFVRDGGRAEPDAIRQQLAGNLCRCTGYQHILDSVVRAIRDVKRSRNGTGKKSTKARARTRTTARESTRTTARKKARRKVSR
jgi:carbon-monoxide dehydrogenase small subunit